MNPDRTDSCRSCGAVYHLGYAEGSCPVCGTTHPSAEEWTFLDLVRFSQLVEAETDYSVQVSVEDGRPRFSVTGAVPA